VSVLDDILTGTRRRLAADLVRYPLDPDAFDAAVRAFDGEREDAASSDGELRALETFLQTYLEAAGE
jgi:hypothetical protein